MTTLILATVLIGCGGNLPEGGTSVGGFPVIDPDDPASITRWEESKYNIHESKISVLELRHFYGELGDLASKERDAVAVRVCGARTKDLAPEQQAAVNHLIENEAVVHAAVREAVYDYYKQSYPAYKDGLSLGAALYGGDAKTIDEILPPISKGNELDDLVQFETIYVHPPKDGTSVIGISFTVPWDEEHGIGLRLEEGTVTAIGTGHEAFPPPVQNH